ncbi:MULTISPECIES: hypothetical protein [Streptomyces]|uniref:hypothetical protein n=1 Tax=Streptomyces TaxID=1883 RepID=UPI0004C90257|nr:MULTISPECIES: hypothetical protein [Streptomyces]
MPITQAATGAADRSCGAGVRPPRTALLFLEPGAVYTGTGKPFEDGKHEPGTSDFYWGVL